MKIILKTILFLTLFTSMSSNAQTSDEMLAQVNKSIQQINTAELKTLLEQDKDAVLIDIRAANEIGIMGGVIDAHQNIHIPRSWLEFRIADAVPDEEATIVVYCGTGVRSPLATKTLNDMGYSNVSNYTESFIDWKKAGLPIRSTDQEPSSILYRKPEKIIDGVWSAIGATAAPTYENSGHNNNLSFIVSNDGVLVVNAGDNYLLAKSLHEEIKKITDQPVKYVVLENGQGHAMLGSNYWKEQGASIIAHEKTASKIQNKGEAILERMQRGRKDKSAFTQIVQVDKTFSDKLVIEMGNEIIEILHFGAGHSPDDVLVWLPKKQLVISGDMAFHQRMLPIFEDTDTVAWLENWEKFAALNAKIVIPGHGDATDMATVTKYTKDYLLFLRQAMTDIIDDGGDLQAAYLVDQSKYAHLHAFRELHKRNAEQLFRTMEFE